MTYNSIAFFTGLFGSLHCVVMCGPLVMSIPSFGGFWSGLFEKLVYQFGRIITYGILGAIAGSVGGAFSLMGLQQVISLLSGGILILIAFSQFSQAGNTRISKIQTRLSTPVAKFIGTMLSKPGGKLLAGMLHGLIPCGMVYLAIIGSLNTASILEGGVFMLFFGLGTIPLLLGVAIAPMLIRKVKVPKMFFPALYLIAGGFLILRGLNTGIPAFTHPVHQESDISVCSLIQR